MKKCLWVLILLIEVLICTACSSQTVKIDNAVLSTDLSVIEVSGATISIPIDKIDVSWYTPSNQYVENQYEYNYEELRFFTNSDGLVTRIQMHLPSDDFFIGGNGGFTTIDQITKILGTGFNEYWFDREQGLKAHTYVDKDKRVSATFVYVASEQGELVWVFLEEL